MLAALKKIPFWVQVIAGLVVGVALGVVARATRAGHQYHLTAVVMNASSASAALCAGRAPLSCARSRAVSSCAAHAGR